MKTYRVEWSIDVDADTPELAAKRAWAMMRGEHSTANVFEVLECDGTGEAVMVDLQELNEKEPTA